MLGKPVQVVPVPKKVLFKKKRLVIPVDGEKKKDEDRERKKQVLGKVPRP